MVIEREPTPGEQGSATEKSVEDGTKMKTIKALCLTLLLGLAVFAGSGPAVAAVATVANVSVPAVSKAGPGADVVVPITVSPADGVVSMQFDLSYNPAVITPTGVYKTAFTNSFELVYNVPSTGDLRITLYATAPLTGSGEVAWIVFRALGAPGTSSPLTWLQHELNENNIPSSASGGVVRAVAPHSTIS